MKLHPAATLPLNTVTAYGHGYIEINEVRYDSAVVFDPHGEVAPWAITHRDDITIEVLYEACGLKKVAVDPMAFLNETTEAPARDPNQPEILLIGTGTNQHLLAHETLAALQQRGVGVEAMSTPAAARTYNVLMAEGRHVVAALLLTEES